MEKGIRIGRFVRVACPARGVVLASRRLDLYLSVVLIVVNDLLGDTLIGAVLKDVVLEIALDVAQAQATFAYWQGLLQARTIRLEKVLLWSPRNEADFALASLSEEVPPACTLTVSGTEVIGFPQHCRPREAGQNLHHRVFGRTQFRVQQQRGGRPRTR